MDNREGIRQTTVQETFPANQQTLAKTKDPVMNETPPRRSSMLRTVKNIAILLLPVAFVLVMTVVTPLAATLGLFYARVEMSLLIAVTLFPLTWIYLLIRTSSPKAAKHFSIAVTSIALILLSISTAIETAGVAPLVAIEKEFKVPEGWTKQTEGNGAVITPGAGLLGCIGLIALPVCPHVKSTWEKEQDIPMTVEDL